MGRSGFAHTGHGFHCPCSAGRRRQPAVDPPEIGLPVDYRCRPTDVGLGWSGLTRILSLSLSLSVFFSPSALISLSLLISVSHPDSAEKKKKKRIMKKKGKKYMKRRRNSSVINTDGASFCSRRGLIYWRV
jgi:hypothetical protein